MKTIALYSGKIETRNRECFIGNQKIECPKSGKATTIQGDKLDFLPQIAGLDQQSNLLFTSILVLVILGFVLLIIFKIKIFGKTLIEYVKPIWYFVLISIFIVLWQYLFGLRIDDNLMAIRISQWAWEAIIVLSAYKLSRIPNFSYGNMFFLGVIYSVVIHGLKIAIRYYFYDKTLLYVLDRFLYGSFLVMVMAFILGSAFVYLKKGTAVK